MWGNDATGAANLLAFCKDMDDAFAIERQQRNMRYQDIIAALQAENARLLRGCQAGSKGLAEASSLIKDLKNERDDYKQRVAELEAKVAQLEVYLDEANQRVVDANKRWVREHNEYVVIIRDLEKQYGFKYFPN